MSSLVKRKIIARNCYRMAGGVMQEIPVGTIIEAAEGAFGAKAVTVDEPKQERTLEASTPVGKPRRGRRKAVKDDAQND